MSPSTRKCAARPAGPYGLSPKRKCSELTHRQTAALCSKHESQWRAVAKSRAAARRALAAQAAADAPVVAEQPAAELDQSLTARNQRALAATRARS